MPNRVYRVDEYHEDHYSCFEESKLRKQIKDKIILFDLTDVLPKRISDDHGFLILMQCIDYKAFRSQFITDRYENRDNFRREIMVNFLVIINCRFEEHTDLIAIFTSFIRFQQ